MAIYESHKDYIYSWEFILRNSKEGKNLHKDTPCTFIFTAKNWEQSIYPVRMYFINTVKYSANIKRKSETF